ncbi:MAG: DUF533 domain-containing protein [Pseudomonadota bacterium]
MVDVTQILKDLQLRAETAAEEFDVDTHVESAKDVALKVKERLETDETARNLTIGGGVLLAGMLASRGGRRMLGTVAKTGLVAAMGAAAYRAWQNRSEGSSADAPEDAPPGVAALGYVADDAADSAFSEALVLAMASAAYADGVIDPNERANIDGMSLGADEAIARLVDGSHSLDDCLDLIVAAAKTPNLASQLYAAAVVASGAPSVEESEFLGQLARRLGIAADQAASLSRSMQS